MRGKVGRTWPRRHLLGMVGGSAVTFALPSCMQAEPKPQLTPAIPAEPVDMAALTPVEQVLAQRPFSVDPSARRDIYSSRPLRLFDEAGPSTPLMPGDMTEDEARKVLEKYLQNEPPEVAAQARILFEHPNVKATIPSPILRTAFAGLPGTSASSAADFILSGKIGAIVWNESASYFQGEYERGFARVFTEIIGRIFYFNPRYRGRNINPFLLTNMMVHEPLHQDKEVVSDLEEAIATAFDTFFLLEQLSRHPDMLDGTELSRRMAGRALIRFNSGNLARLGLYRTNGNKLVVPDSQRSARSWFENFDGRAYEKVDNWDEMETPGNQLLVEYMDAIGAPSQGRYPNFSKAVLDAIDKASYPSLSPDKLLVVAKHLDLEIPPLSGVATASGR